MLDTKAEALVGYVRGLQGFKVREDLDYGSYNHVGATLVAVILQAGLNWKTTVQPRVESFRQQFPEASTLSGFLGFLQQNDLAAVLKWSDRVKPDRIVRLAKFLNAEGVETESDLRVWLSSEENSQRLLNINGVGQKSVEFAKMCVRIQTNAPDRHLIGFLNQAGIETRNYEERRSVINRTADLMEVDRISLDFSIWAYMSESGRKKASPVCRRSL